jgi:replicative DNA helicase
MFNNRGNKKRHEEVIMTPEEYISKSNFIKQHLTRVTSNGVEMKDTFEGIPPYLLGLWVGDGRKQAFTILVNKDEEPELLHYLGMIAQMKNIPFELKKSDSPKIVEFAFKGINQSLRDIGVYNNKHIPEQYIKSSIDTRLQLLAGLIDSDGYSDKKKGNIEIGMSKKHIIESIRLIALSCGISCSNVVEATTNFKTTSYSVNLSGDLARIPIITKKKSFEEMFKTAYDEKMKANQKITTPTRKQNAFTNKEKI